MSDSIFFKIRERKAVTFDTVVYVLEPLQGEMFKYKPGQFVTFVFRHTNGELRRSYSLSTTPEVDEFPSIVVRRISNGEVSRYLHDNWKVGDEVEALLPAGRFTLEYEGDRPKDVFLLAAGSGISPLFGILKHTLHSQLNTHVHLFYSNHNVSSTIFYDELNTWKEKYAERFDIDYFFSESKYLERARLNRLLLEKLVKQHLKHKMEDALFFLCGPYGYMQMAEIVLITMGIPKENIRKEIFVIEKPAESKFSLDDKSPKKVEIKHRGKSYLISVAYPSTILEAALKEGISLPYSCRAGRCSACFAKCTEGKVAMSYNEVLTESDESLGMVLTCTGHPVSDLVKLEF